MFVSKSVLSEFSLVYSCRFVQSSRLTVWVRR